MSSKIWFRVLISVILLAALIGAGLWVYNMGVVQGAAVDFDGELPAVFSGRYMPHGGMISEYGHGGMFFSPFRFLGGIIFLFFILAGFRLLFFGFRGHGHFRHHRYGKWQECGPDGVPPMVEDWHRKMHEKETTVSEE
ncbi:MAG: hypothetical protein JEZ00_10860 [Anaerolineaceae bacterium]|nr:hypothetical protein [Anaerolineaceae bacterium]